MINILIAILILSVVIIAHEFGHFIIAKANGICVVEFSIGFGPRIFSFRIGDTDYCLKALPFGGSCRMLGENEYIGDDSQDEDGGEEYELSDYDKHAKAMFEKYGKNRTLESKSVSARIAVLAAGPVFNFLFALVLSIIMIGSTGYDPCVVDRVNPDTPAYEAGLSQGDTITKINGHNITFAREYFFYRTYHEPESFNITYKRDGKKYTALVTPEIIKEKSYKIGVKYGNDMRVSEVLESSAAQEAGIKMNDKIISVNNISISNINEFQDIIKSSEGAELDMVVERSGRQKNIKIKPQMMETESYEYGFDCFGGRITASPPKTIYLAFADTGYRINTVVELLGRMISGKMSVNNLSGPVGTVSAISSVVDDSKKEGAFYLFINILNIAIMLSANLGVMNLLPIPALDGGRLIVYIIEAIRGKPVPKKAEYIINFIGVIILLVLTGYILIKDIIFLF